MQLNDTPELRARVWSKIDSSGQGCWNWTAGRTTASYGETWDGKHVLYAHRVIYTFIHGSIPAGWFVCHHCDNPSCCRPSHLFLGTHDDNMRDMFLKGRQPKERPNGRGDNNGRRKHPERYQNVVVPAPRRGESNPRAKLTEHDVLYIRSAVANGSVKQLDLARQFGVSTAKISQIVLRQAWKHIA